MPSSDTPSSHPRRRKGKAGQLVDLGLGLASGVITQAGDAARQGALKLAQASLGRTALTLPLPSPLLNQGLRQRMRSHPNIDHLSVSCGDDQLVVKVDGHVQRMLFTVEMTLLVLACEVTRSRKVLRLRQIDEGLDLQWREAPVLVNWAARHVGRQAFRLVNRFPVPSLTQQVIQQVPGLSRAGHREWEIDLEAAGCMSILEDRHWMLERLEQMTDFSLLPGLNVIRESRDVLQQLVGQFEVRGVRVQPGRLDVKVGISGS